MEEAESEVLPVAEPLGEGAVVGLALVKEVADRDAHAVAQEEPLPLEVEKGVNVGEEDAQLDSEGVDENVEEEVAVSAVREPELLRLLLDVPEALPDDVAVAKAVDVRLEEKVPVAEEHIVLVALAVEEPDPDILSEPVPVTVARVETLALAEKEPDPVSEAEDVSAPLNEAIAVMVEVAVKQEVSEPVAVEHVVLVALAVEEPDPDALAVEEPDPDVLAEPVPVAVARAEALTVLAADDEPVKLALDVDDALAVEGPVALLDCEAASLADEKALAETGGVALAVTEGLSLAVAEGLIDAEDEVLVLNVIDPEALLDCVVEALTETGGETLGLPEEDPEALLDSVCVLAGVADGGAEAHVKGLPEPLPQDVAVEHAVPVEQREDKLEALVLIVEEPGRVAAPVAVPAPVLDDEAVAVADRFALDVAEKVAVEEHVTRFTEEPAGHSDGQPQGLGAPDPAGQ